jgi:hypothetical protein
MDMFFTAKTGLVKLIFIKECFAHEVPEPVCDGIT